MDINPKPISLILLPLKNDYPFPPEKIKKYNLLLHHRHLHRHDRTFPIHAPYFAANIRYTLRRPATPAPRIHPSCYSSTPLRRPLRKGTRRKAAVCVCSVLKSAGMAVAMRRKGSRFLTVLISSAGQRIASFLSRLQMSRFAGIGNSEIDPFLYFIKKGYQSLFTTYLVFRIFYLTILKFIILYLYSNLLIIVAQF